MKKPILIFDFDGTIADTHHYSIEISNRMADEFKYNPILPHEIEPLKDKTSQEIIKYLKISTLKIPAIIAKGKREYYEGLDKIQPIKNLKETLEQLKKLSVTMGILSSNNVNNISKFLENHNMDIFEFVHTTSKVWGKHLSLKKIIQKENLDKENVIYVGDETRDIVAAKKIKIKVAAVTWGYNSIKALQQYNPDYVLNTPEDLFHLGQNGNP